MLEAELDSMLEWWRPYRPQYSNPLLPGRRFDRFLWKEGDWLAVKTQWYGPMPQLVFPKSGELSDRLLLVQFQTQGAPVQ